MALVLSQEEIEELMTEIDGGLTHPKKTSQQEANVNTNGSKPLSNEEFNAVMALFCGEGEPAEIDYAEQLETNRKLLKTDPVTYLPEFLMSLNGLAGQQCKKGNYTEAETHYTTALDIYRKLAKTKGYIPGLTTTLRFLAEVKEKLSKIEEARNIYLELLNIRQNQAKTDPDTYSPMTIKLQKKLSEL